MVGYIQRWFTCPQTVTYPNTNRARRRATLLIETNALTTAPNRTSDDDDDDDDDTIESDYENAGVVLSK